MIRKWLRWPSIRPESAQLAGWAMVALATLVTTRIAPARELRPALAAVRDAVVAGHLLAAGLCAYAAVALWRRFGPKRPLVSLVAIAIVAIAVSAPTLREDLAVFAAKIRLPYAIARALSVVAVAAAVPIAAVLGRLTARPWLRIAGVIAAIALAVVNHFFLVDDYLGVHLVAALSAATLFGAAAATPDASASRAAKFGLGALALLAAGALLVRVPNSVALAVQRVPGDVVAPWLARLRGDDDGDIDARELGAFVDAAHAEWWKSRLGRAPIAPSSPPLLPKNAIVVLITVDCMRADVLANAKHAATLPTFFALRNASVELAETRATATATTQSVSAIFTGRYYSQLYWKQWSEQHPEYMYPNADDTQQFTELLSAAGVTTATLSGMPGFSREYGVVKGFRENQLIKGARGYPQAAEIMGPVIARIAAQGPGPLFLHTHFTDAHAPYAHGTAKGAPFDQYLRGLAMVDKELGALLAKIDADPALRERTAIIVSADHGEAFGEHRSFHHATTVYEELLRVPLLVRLPGVAHRTVTQPVSLIDLAPTILDLFGLPTPGEMMGQSLVPFFRGESPALTRPIVADTSRLQRAVVFADGLKIIHDRRRDTVELFDLKRDPRELRDIFDQSGPAGAARLHALRAFFHTHTLKRPGYKVPYGR